MKGNFKTYYYLVPNFVLHSSLYCPLECSMAGQWKLFSVIFQRIIENSSKFNALYKLILSKIRIFHKKARNVSYSYENKFLFQISLEWIKSQCICTREDELTMKDERKAGKRVM